MSVALYLSKLDQIGEALAEHLASAPVLKAEECEVISKVDDSVSDLVAERVGKAGGLIALVAVQSFRPISAGAPGPRITVTWNISLWARRSSRTQRNAAVTLAEAMLARVQGWIPEGGLCYDEFRLVEGSQQPHPKYVIYEATFSASVQIAAPTLIPTVP